LFSSDQSPLCAVISPHPVALGGAMNRSDSQTKLRDEWPRKQQPKARDVLLSWARVGKYREQATRYVKLAREASEPDVRDRFITIARHYRALTQAEERTIGHDATIRRRSPN